MINCLIIDDEPLALDILCDYIEQIPDLHLVAQTTNPVEGLALLQLGQIDLLFLDVQMPELTGIQFLKAMDESNCRVILTTAYPEYALDGYDLNVLDYLLKPIAFERFKKAIQKVRQNRLLVDQANTTQEDNFIFVKSEYKLQRIDLDDILYIEGLKDYISIYTGQERIITLQNMKRMEETLPVNRFARVHKSYIVALDKIQSIEKGKIRMQEIIIPIGDTFKEEFFQKINGLSS